MYAKLQRLWKKGFSAVKLKVLFFLEDEFYGMGLKKSRKNPNVFSSFSRYADNKFKKIVWVCLKSHCWLVTHLRKTQKVSLFRCLFFLPLCDSCCFFFYLGQCHDVFFVSKKKTSKAAWTIELLKVKNTVLRVLNTQVLVS